MPAQQHFLDAGDTVVFETRDASDYFYSPDSTHEDVTLRAWRWI